MPKDVYNEAVFLPLVCFCAIPKGEKIEDAKLIGCAFFLMDDPARLVWIAVNEEFIGTDLAHLLLEYSEEYLKKEGISGIFATLFGDYFSTLRGNSFLDKNDFEVLKQNKRLIFYKKDIIGNSPRVEVLIKKTDKLCANVMLLDRKKQRHKVYLLENAGDIRTNNPVYTDTENSFVYMKENYMAGFTVSLRGAESEIFVADFCVVKGPIGAEATKGLLATILKKCIGNKNLSFITKNEDQRNLLIQLIGTPQKDVPYWEYYKALNARGDDIDG